jgi:aconitate hydratase
MGVMPLVFKNGQNRKSLKLNGTEIWDLTGMADGITPGMDVNASFTRKNGNKESITLLSRIETLDEVDYYLHGGILKYVLRKMLTETA